MSKVKQNKLSLFLSLILISLTIITTNAQESSIQEDSTYANYLLINSLTKKIITISDAGPYNITYITEINDSLKVADVFLLTGNIRTLENEFLEFDVRNESIEQNFKDGSIISTSHNYSSHYYSENHLPRKVDLKSIQYMNYSKPARQVVHSIGIGTMFVSAATTLVFAPLFNYNFKTHQFSSKQYLDVVKFGLMGFSIGVPITYLTRVKKYNIGNKDSQNKDVWYFEKVENLQQ